MDHAETQEFRDHSLAKRKQQVVSQSMLSAILDYEKYDSYSVSLYSEKLLERKLTNNYYYQLTNPLQYRFGWYL